MRDSCSFWALCICDWLLTAMVLKVSLFETWQHLSDGVFILADLKHFFILHGCHSEVRSQANGDVYYQAHKTRNHIQDSWGLSWNVGCFVTLAAGFSWQYHPQKRLCHQESCQGLLLPLSIGLLTGNMFLQDPQGVTILEKIMAVRVKKSPGGKRTGARHEQMSWDPWSGKETSLVRLAARMKEGRLSPQSMIGRDGDHNRGPGGWEKLLWDRLRTIRAGH